MIDREWELLARRSSHGYVLRRRYVRFLELVPLVRLVLSAGGYWDALEDLDEGDPEKELSYVGTALVQGHLARHGWNPPPAYIWTVN